MIDRTEILEVRLQTIPLSEGKEPAERRIELQEAGTKQRVPPEIAESHLRTVRATWGRQSCLQPLFGRLGARVVAAQRRLKAGSSQDWPPHEAAIA